MPDTTINMVKGGEATRYQVLRISSDTTARAKALYEEINQGNFQNAQVEIDAIRENLEFIQLTMNLL